MPDCCSIGLGFLNQAYMASEFPSSCSGYYSELFPFTREPATYCITAFGILTIFNTLNATNICLIIFEYVENWL